ncbi:MAG: helix-turn-helix domain-containing protein [Actinobacteria bacterium]|nr:helix-turn-helix domain-containing protein [Actinomycetota bacterium]MBI3688416.1 helix-turn-helix domain-containing protein [Actinomycetota bacterium]
MSAQPDLDDRTYLPGSEQADVLDFLAALRARGRDAASGGTRLVAADGHEIELPDGLLDVLVQVAVAMRAGLAVTVAPHHLTLSTQEAADLLGVSRMTVVRLLDAGQIPFEQPGRHRRLRLVDVLEHQDRQRRHAEQALSDMVADSELLGLYDNDPQAVREALAHARAHRVRG